MNIRLAAPVAAALVAGCVTSSTSLWPVGLVVHGTEQATTVTTSFKMVGDEAAVEQKGTVGAAAICSVAKGSSGTRTETEWARNDIRTEVMGDTKTDHPLIPGKDSFGQVNVSVVFEEVTSTGNRQILETFRSPEGTPSDWSETYAEDFGNQTVATTYGVAADEYVVKLYPLDLWTGLDTDMPVDTGDGGPPAPGAQTATLVTRHNAGPGDIWTSLNGNVVYRFGDWETLSIGGKSRKTARIQVFNTTNADAIGTSIFEQCLKTAAFEDTTSFPDQPSILTEEVRLDPGCQGDFMHMQVGTQWWHENVLVRAETTTWNLSVSQYGYEWGETVGDTCVRMTSGRKPTYASDAELFVQYDVALTNRSFLADTFDKAGKVVQGIDTRPLPSDGSDVEAEAETR